jgi:hypothetical protein
MFTSIDKAITAFIMALISILSLAFNINIGIDPTTLSGIIAALTPFLVYFIPNKKPV